MQDQTLLKLSLVVNLGFLVLASLAFLRPPSPPPQYVRNGSTENKIEIDAYNCANSIEEVRKLMSTQVENAQTMYEQLKQQDQALCNCPSAAPLPNYSDRKSYSCDTTEINYCEQFGGFSSWNFKTGKQSPDLCTYLHCIKQTGHLFGVNTPVGAETNGMGMFALGPADLTFLDFVIAQHQELINITEFGTASGLTSAYLGMICKLRGGEMHTFDWVSGIRCNEALTLWDDKYMKFIQADLLSSTNPVAKESLQRGPLFAFMDNGRKKQEINVYARYLPVGSILLTHDWGVEIFLEDIKAELDNRGFVPIYEQLAVVLGANTRAWYRDSPGHGGVAIE